MKHLLFEDNGDFRAGTLQLPAGKSHVDEFFGEVETYRDAVRAVLPGQGQGTVTLRVKYQGCADLGICYPPQTREVTVALPAGLASGGVDRLPAAGGLLPGTARPSLLGGGDEPLPEAQAFGFDAIARDADTLLLRFAPAPGYYLYRDRTAITLSGAAAKATGLSAGALQWPPGTSHEDEFFGRTTVYFEPVEVALPLRRARAGGGALTVTASFQGCQDEGICYPPMTRTVELLLPEGAATPVVRPTKADAVASDAADDQTDGASRDDATRDRAAVDPAAGVGAATAAKSQPAETPQGQGTGIATDDSFAAGAVPAGEASSAPVLGEDQQLAAKLAGQGRGVALLLFLGAGLLLAFTPCVLPMIPILSGLIAGASAAHGGRLGSGRALALSSVYILANALVFTAAGVVAGLLGANLQVAFQHPWVITAFALLFVALALSMFGLYELQLPAALRARLGEVLVRAGRITPEQLQTALTRHTPLRQPLGQALGQAGTVAAQTGLSLEETVAALSMFADEGIRGSDAGTSLKTMLQRLTPQSKESAGLMEELGLSAYDSQGNFIGLSEYAGQLRDKLSGMSDEQRNATMQTAITMHHSPRVTLAAGPVACLLSAGAGVDVAGLRCWEAGAAPDFSADESISKSPGLSSSS